MTRQDFESLVREALYSIPKAFRDRLRNVAIVIEDDPDPALLEEMGIEPPDTLFGLYQGTPLTARSWDYGNTLPDRITLFQRPIEADAEDEDDVFAIAAETIIHEAGHYFGLSEEEIEAIERDYWRALDAGEDEDEDEDPGTDGRDQ